MQDRPLYTEAGVQTDSKMFEENQVRLGGWRREVRDGATLLWRERLPTRGTEMWTQTEDLQNGGGSEPPVTYETIDLNALQALGETEPLQIPYVPMSVVYSNEDNHGYGQSSLSAAISSRVVHYSSVQNNVFSTPGQAMADATETPHWGQNVERTAGIMEWAEEGFEQFKGNITGFIDYFLNPEHEEGSNRTRGRRRQGAGGARQTGTRGRPRGRSRGRGGLTQTVDTQDVGVSKLSKMYLQRWSMYVNRTGQGGGAVGRKLYVKSRELVRCGRSTRKGRRIKWDLDQCATILPKTKAGNRGQSGRQRTAVNAPLQALVSPPQRPQRVTKRSPARGPEEQPEQINLLLEEVMMGLDILPNKNKKSEATSSTNRRGGPAAVKTDRRHAGSTAVPSSEVPVLQQQNEGELTDILDQFLQSFELESATAQSSSVSSETRTSVNQYRKHNIQLSVHTLQGSSRSVGKPAVFTGTPGRPGTSTQSETSGTDSTTGQSQASAQSQRRKRSGKSSPGKRRPARRRRDYLFSLEKPRTKSKKGAVRDALKKEQVKQGATKQLQQIPVVKLERRGALPENMKVQEHSQRPGPRAKKSPSATSLWDTKTYPIRSRFKDAQITDISLTTVEEQKESNEDEAGSDPRAPERRRRKRTLDSSKEMSSAVQVKKMCLDSERGTTQTTDTELIDVETISLNSTNNAVIINNTGRSDLSTEECSTDPEGRHLIDVDSLDRNFETRPNREDLVHAEVICSLRADIVTAGEPDDLDDDVDVIGGSSPAPAPVLISWTDSEETENDTDTDVPEEQTVVLSKGRLVRC